MLKLVFGQFLFYHRKDDSCIIL